MFQSLGQYVTRFWPLILVGWVGLFIVAVVTMPSWEKIAPDGELMHLPADMPTRRGGHLLDRAFPRDISDSRVVLVVHRPEEPLQPRDKQFVRGPLVQGLRQVAEDHGGLVGTRPLAKAIPHEVKEVAEAIASHGMEMPEELKPLLPRPPRRPDRGEQPPRVVSITSIDDPFMGSMLVSADGHATLVSVGLTSEFLRTRNEAIVGAIEELVGRLERDGTVPRGLRVDFTGSASVGTTTIREVTASTRAVRRWAMWIAVILLFFVFRAPIAALLPLATMYVAVEVALALLAWGAVYGIHPVFEGLKLYVTVIVYGAGVDYSLFLLSRYEELLCEGEENEAAVSGAVASVSRPITASAGTEIVGIGLLATTAFGKFQQAGVGIAFGLFVLLIASLTLTPAMLCFTRRWTVWPHVLHQGRGRTRLSFSWLTTRIWRSIGRLQRKCPAMVLVSVLAIMTPAAVVGARNLENLSYGLMDALPANSPAVRGFAALRKYFDAGMTDPITVLLRNDSFDFSSHAGIREIGELTARLRQQDEKGEISDIRSVSDPLGHGERAREIIDHVSAVSPLDTFLDRGQLVVTDDSGLSAAEQLLQEIIRDLSYQQYVSHTTFFDGTVTRMTVIPTGEPFRLESIQELDVLEKRIRGALPARLADSEVYLLGGTASLRDIRDIAQRDWHHIRVVVPIGVLMVLLVLFRRPLVSSYLILTVAFSFLVTFGVTHTVFHALNPPGFEGLDWTVPVLLFTLLVAVGEDYSVLLVARTEEERQDHTPTRGVTEAVVKTGGLISGAGLIMAGTFSALMFGGQMAGMHQLGFALCIGVLIDSFLVRPLLVPSFLDLLARGRLYRRTVLSYLAGYRHGPRGGADEPVRQRAAAEDFKGNDDQWLDG